MDASGSGRYLSQWPLFSLLSVDFLRGVKIVCVFGSAGNEAILVTHEDEVFALGSNCSSCLGLGDSKSSLQPRKVESLCKQGTPQTLCAIVWFRPSDVLQLITDLVPLHSLGLCASWWVFSFAQIFTWVSDDRLVLNN